MRAYSSARRMTSWFCTQWPSSVSATTPALASEPMGASSSPARPLVIAPVGKTLTHDSRAAFSWIHETTLGLSTGGLVFGMQTTDVKPPAAAARVPLAMVSFADWPGSRRCTWMSMRPGATTRPAASMVSSTLKSRSRLRIGSAMRPSMMSKSPGLSRPFAGSMIRPPWISIVFIVLRKPIPAGNHSHRGRAPPCARRGRW